MADALVKVLNAFGYVPVFLPRTGFHPPDLYNFAEGRLKRRGSLAAYLPGEVRLPENRKGKASDLFHRETSGKKLVGAASFLENALRCIGVSSPPKLDLSFAGGKEIAFAFTEVTFETCDGLDQVLRGLELGAIPHQYVEEGRLHVAYEYLYAKSLVLQRSDHQSFAVDITGAKIAEFINLGTQAAVSAESSTSIKFTSTSKDRAAFAYKAGRLESNNGRWEFYPEQVQRTFAGEERTPYLPAAGVVLPVEES